MANIVGINHGKRPVLEIRHGEIQIWKSPGWATPSTSIGLLTTVTLANTTGDIVKTWGDQFAQKGTDGTTWTIYGDDFKPASTFSTNSASWFISSTDIAHQYLTLSSSSGTNIFKTSDMSKPIASSSTYYYFDQTVAMKDGAVFAKTNGANVNYPNYLFKVVNGGFEYVTANFINNYAISSYDDNFYSYQAGGAQAKINKMDSKGNVLVTGTPDNKTVVEVSRINPTTHQAVYDAAGNMFALGHNGTIWYITKATTGGALTEVAVNLLIYMQMYIDKIGNIYLFDVPNSSSDYYGNRDVRVTKLSNNLEQQWQKTIGKGLIDNTNPNVMVTDSGLIYVQRATQANQTGRVLDVYQQTNI